MFTKILIANRGEIACRVIKTAQRLGIQTVAVYSDADRDALHTKMADEAFHIGGSPSSESYLLSDKIIEVALASGAQAIHPGYGFLSENADFAEQCKNNSLVFIGPPVNAIKSMGSKSAAKTIMAEAGVPLVPGYHGDDQDAAILKSSADSMGYPVLLKAVAGGGGKGMRQVWSADEFAAALSTAKSESMASFGNDDMLVEKYLTQPRHVEVQVFCDQHGNGVYLFERDCSIQRRHQKIIEEAPAPNMPSGLREQMGETAVQAAKAINYEGAGTVEFLLDADGSFYFMEMNTRLQVEHPVTEMITGQDLVDWQLQVAAGMPLPLQQHELTMTGHAFEARIYAEDPNNEFLPTSGRLDHVAMPEENAHVRIDTGVSQGDDVSPYYDPMISKLIVWDENRDRALSRLANALSEYRISGVTNNIQFLYDLACSEPFKQADLDTGFLEKHHDSIFKKPNINLDIALPLACLYLRLDRNQKLGDFSAPNDPFSPWNSLQGWRMNQPNVKIGGIVANDEHYDVVMEQLNEVPPQGEWQHFILEVHNSTYTSRAYLKDNRIVAEINGHSLSALVMPTDSHFTLFVETGALDFYAPRIDYGEADDGQSDNNFSAPMNGTVIDVLISAGAEVKEGDALVIMEAMKMQHTISAPSDGVVDELFCAAGELVDGGAALLSFSSSEPGSE